MIDFIISSAESKADVNELHEKNESTYTSENEYNVCEKHLKNLKMICMKII